MKDLVNKYLSVNEATDTKLRKQINNAEKKAKEAFEKFGRDSKEYKKATDIFMDFVMKSIEDPK